MVSEKEETFLRRWEAVRDVEGTFKHKLLSGMPMAFLFALPTLVLFIVVKVFFPSWFATATHRKTEIVVPGLTEQHMGLSTGDIIMAFIAVLVVVLFFSYFRMHYKWENNEQLYKELKSMQKKKNNAAV